MTDLNLTPEERDIAEGLARDRHGAAVRVGYYVSFLVPMLLFAGYGVAHRDVLAMGIALAGVLTFVGWRIGREVAQIDTYKSLLRKVVEHERRAAYTEEPDLRIK